MFAQLTGWGFAQIVKAIIIIAACIGILMVACQQFGVIIPAWAIKIYWIVVVACVAIFAIRFLLGM